MRKIQTVRHVMIDLETMSTQPDCAIVSIGAVLFAPEYGKVTDETFYAELDWRAQSIALKRDVSLDTMIWWGKQGEDVRAALNGSMDLSGALIKFSGFLPPKPVVWGNGSIFDIAILENAYRQLNIPIPWAFWDILDCRTIKRVYEISRGGLGDHFDGLKHNSLADAINQARQVTKMWHALRAD